MGMHLQKFRHDIPDHEELCCVVTVITQLLCISHDEPLFQVPDSENP
jgi:hypothetical protein